MRKWVKYFFILGRPLSPLYSLVMRFRAFLYKHNLLKHHRVSVPVVSVGNLTMGGTGKTPLVMHLAKLISGHGFKPAVVSRGYGGNSKEEINVVSDGKAILLSAKIAGDEPRFLAENLTGIPVLIGPKRAGVCRRAIDSFAVDTILLDDGFQHLATDRQLDLVLFNGRSILGSGWVFPGGVLREPISALKRAHAFIFTGVGEGENSEVNDFVAFLLSRFPNRPCFFAPYKLDFIYEMGRGKETKYESGSDLPGPLFAFCGLANPETFKVTLEQNDIPLAGFMEFRDHHEYSHKDLQLILEESKRRGASGLITTEKDRVKLDSVLPDGLRVFVLKVSLAVQSELDDFVLQRIKSKY